MRGVRLRNVQARADTGVVGFKGYTTPSVSRHYRLCSKKGAIERGSDADYTIIDTQWEWVVDEKKLQSLCGYAPQYGMTAKGKAARTMARAPGVYDEGRIKACPGWGFFIPRQTNSELTGRIPF